MAKKARRSKAGRKTAPVKKSLFKSKLFWKAFGLMAFIFIGWVVYLDFTVRAKFDGKKWAIPARVYAQPLEVYEGQALTPEVLEKELEVLGYQFSGQLAKPGQVVKNGNRYSLYSKGFVFWDKAEQASRYEVEFDQNRVVRLEGAEDLVLRLEPREIGSIYPSHGEDRILVQLTDIPPLLGETLIAVEDKDFARHFGVSPRGIARAMFANVKAGGLVQGGSTLTQQLVKNFYLTRERSLWRKAQEAVMSILLEVHYSKAEILEAYLNEVYLGQSGPRAIHGFGLAAQHYFNQPVNTLQPHQIALLVGIVKGASYYNPWRFPERATERRNLVLQLMADDQLIDNTTLTIAQRKPLDLSDSSKQQLGDYPAFLDLVKRQLQQHYQAEDLQSEGLRIFTTMSHSVQRSTEQAVSQRLKTLNAKGDDLQAAAIITSVGSGEVQAVVGDRSPRFSGFNRALDAERQIGSLVKPFVYLTALMQPDLYQLSSIVDDSEIAVPLDNGELWEPTNYTEESHGEMLLYQALAFSYNQATARLGMELGVESVIRTMKMAGMLRELEPYPAVLLGSPTLTPFEVSHLYHTIAADGVFTPLRAIRSVLDANNRPLQRYPLHSETRISPEYSHLMHYALQSVMRIGTGRRAYQKLPVDLALAGKTGTTNDQRDSWFAGYSGDHLGVVWVGKDNNQPTWLTGSSGALPIWVDVFADLNTRGIAQTAPETIEYYWIDAQNGLRTAEGCLNAQLIPFVAGSEPKVMTSCAGTGSPIKKWFKRFFN